MTDRHKLRFCILALWVCLVKHALGIVHHKGECQSPAPHPRHGNKMIEKVTFTQKGYIQFLKYVKEVPVITEYTFCVWLRSHNLTYNHPLLSYSKHEEERLIRVWITPRGRSIKLEILNRPVFEVPLKISECEWHHYCQSWSSYQGAWSVFFDGKILSHGYAPQLKGTFIKGGGDIVVGQEYTDFDKGLDDGIEGDVFGFNFVLSPTMKILDSSYKKGDFNMAKVLNHYKPSGLSLVELTYDCSYKYGAPLLGEEVLINWTKSLVRVFGGAVLKRVLPFYIAVIIHGLCAIQITVVTRLPSFFGLLIKLYLTQNIYGNSASEEFIQLGVKVQCFEVAVTFYSTGCGVMYSTGPAIDFVDNLLHRDTCTFDDMDACFNAFDKNCDGTLNLEEFRILCHALFRNNKGETYKLKEEELRDIFQIFDLNGDEQIDKTEFTHCWNSWIKTIVRPISAILIIDVQNDFICGTLDIRNCPAKQNAEEVLQPINNVLDTVDFDAVFYSYDWHPSDHVSFLDNIHLRKLDPTSPISDPDKVQLYDTVVFEGDPPITQRLWPRHCVQNTWGSELHKDLKVVENAVKIYKGTNPEVDSYSAFWDNSKLTDTKLAAQLHKRNITDVYVCGVAYDVCVGATAVDAISSGFRTILLDDCCRGVDLLDIEKTKNNVIKNHGVVVNSDRVKPMVEGNDRRPELGYKLALNIKETMESKEKQ